jgi:hypothetical protein
VLSVAGALVAVASVVTVILVAGGSGSQTGPGRAAVSKTSSSPAASSAPSTSSEVAAALRKLATAPDAVVADEAKPQLAGHTHDAIPPGSTITPHTDSWAPDGLGGGTMLVTVASPGQPTVTYAAVMVFEHNQWKVLATFPTGAAR